MVRNVILIDMLCVCSGESKFYGYVFGMVKGSEGGTGKNI